MHRIRSSSPDIRRLRGDVSCAKRVREKLETKSAELEEQIITLKRNVAAVIPSDSLSVANVPQSSEETREGATQNPDAAVGTQTPRICYFHIVTASAYAEITRTCNMSTHGGPNSPTQCRKYLKTSSDKARRAWSSASRRTRSCGIRWACHVGSSISRRALLSHAVLIATLNGLDGENTEHKSDSRP